MARVLSPLRAHKPALAACLHSASSLLWEQCQHQIGYEGAVQCLLSKAEHAQQGGRTRGC